MSGYFNSCMGLGEAIGPITSGMLVESYGFRHSNDMVGTILFLLFAIFFIVNGHFKLCMPTQCMAEDSDDDDSYKRIDKTETIGCTGSTPGPQLRLYDSNNSI